MNASSKVLRTASIPTARSLLPFAHQLRRRSVSCQPPNKQLERTVIRRHVRAASSPFHHALAACWTAQRAAAQLRR
jgi:hypothetical protein